MGVEVFCRRGATRAKLCSGMGLMGQVCSGKMGVTRIAILHAFVHGQETKGHEKKTFIQELQEY